MVQGVNSGQAAQQSLFSGQTSQSAQSGGNSESSGNVQLEAKISVMKSSMEQQEEQMTKLINSTQGMGQNIDTFA